LLPSLWRTLASWSFLFTMPSRKSMTKDSTSSSTHSVEDWSIVFRESLWRMLKAETECTKKNRANYRYKVTCLLSCSHFWDVISSEDFGCWFRDPYSPGKKMSRLDLNGLLRREMPQVDSRGLWVETIAVRPSRSTPSDNTSIDFHNFQKTQQAATPKQHSKMCGATRTTTEFPKKFLCSLYFGLLVG
jgi:hypothetical protein